MFGLENKTRLCTGIAYVYQNDETEVYYGVMNAPYLRNERDLEGYEYIEGYTVEEVLDLLRVLH
jgi:hypothetical protein